MSRYDEPSTTGGTDHHDRDTHIERLNDRDPFPAQPTRHPTLKEQHNGSQQGAWSSDT